MRRTLFTCTLLAAVVVMSAGCGAGTEQSVEAKQAENAPVPRVIIPVEAGYPAQGAISEYLETISRVEARVRVDVTAEGMGKCIAKYAETGDEVTSGQVLAQLDTTEAAAQLAQNEVQVRQQRADFERAQQGYDFGGMPKAELDAARFAYEQGLASLNVQKLQFDNLTIRSPIDGLVVMENISIGQMISTGSPVYTLVDPSTFQLVIEPPERELSRLRVGQRALVTIDALPGEEFSARVERIDPSADPVSGTIKARVGFDDADKPALREGLFSRVRLVMDTIPDALLVSKDVVVEENGRYYVFVVEEQSVDEFLKARAAAAAELGAPEPPATLDENGEEAAPPPIETPTGPVTIAVRREVEIGLQDSRNLEIRSGLAVTDLLVIVGQSNLKSGAEVTITSAVDAVAANLNLTTEEALQQARDARGDNTGMSRRRLRDEL